MELHHLHVGDARARSPRHRNAIARRAARGGGELVDAARSARSEHSGARDMALDPAGLFVERINAPHAPCGGELLAVAVRDEIDAGAPGEHGDVGRLASAAFSKARILHRPAGCVIDMDDPPVRVAAFAREVQVSRIAVERHAQLAQAINRCPARASITNSTVSTIVEPCARDHRIAHMVFKRIARIEHRRDARLAPMRSIRW